MRVGDGGLPTEPIGVLSAVVVADAYPGRVLLGVRRPTPVAPRFPGVLSTPTLRLPAALFEQLIAGAPHAPDWTDPRPIDCAHAPVLVGRGGHHTSVDGFALEALLVRKLGIAGPLHDGRFAAHAEHRYLVLDEVADPLGTGESEWTAMLSYVVRVDRGADLLPTCTSSYSRLVWADAARLPRALATHDALLLDETLDAIEVCVQGLCLRAAVESLGRPAAAS